MNTQNKELILRLLDALFPGVKVYLFGSRATNTHRPTSDFDFALDAGRKLDFLELARARNVLDTLYIAEKIDLVDMHSIPQTLHDTILQEGVLWKN